MLDTSNGHNQAIVDQFNKVAENFEPTELLDIVLRQFCDDQDLEEITGILQERLENARYMCDNCGGGFTREEIVLDEDNENDLCLTCSHK